MNLDMNDRTAVERRLWDEIERHQVGMLGIVGADVHHTQPMTAFVEGHDLWFFTRADTDLARRIGEGHEAIFVFQAKDLYACLSGELTLSHDEDRIARYWNAVAAAWHPQGKDDPLLTMMRLACREAELWITDGGPMRFAWEIAMANARKHEPHLGGKANLRFH